MAEPFDTLIAVQDHDTTLAQLRHRIDAMPERAELREVESRRASNRAAQVVVEAQVEDLAGRQRALEEQIAAAAQRRHEIERRMESGDVSASRDLQAMDLEVHHLAARQVQFEEEEMALLEEEEPLDLLAEEYTELATALDEEVARLEAVIAEAVVGFEQAIKVEETSRAEIASRLPPELADRYEVLRSHLGGVGAARLVGDRCDGCHLNLSSVDIERIRRLPHDEFATCPQCDRILVH
jgi:predicted  nucleic acid-binding Zn-ribbon protein